MAVNAHFYKGFFDALARKEIHLTSDTLKMMVVTASYTPLQDTHDYKNDVTNEVSGTGYTAGGLALTSVALAYNTGTNVWSFTCSPISWGTVTWTNGRYGIIYDSTPATDATRPLISYVDFDANFSPSAGVFTVTMPASGAGTVTIS